MAVWEGKKYKMVSSENFDEFMVALGVGLLTRKAANALTPTLELQRDGAQFVLVTATALKTIELRFTPGQQFEEERADGAKVQTVCTWEGAGELVLRQLQTGADGEQVLIVREFSADQLKTVMTAKGVTCTRIYKA